MNTTRILSYLCLAGAVCACSDETAEEQPTTTTTPPTVSNLPGAMQKVAREEGFVLSAVLDAYRPLAATKTDAPTYPKRFPRVLVNLLRSWESMVSSDCVEMTPYVDEDADGIPATFTATFDCAQAADGGRTITVTGSIDISDASDAEEGAARDGFDIVFRELRTGKLLPAVAGEGLASRRLEHARVINGKVAVRSVESRLFEANVSSILALRHEDDTGILGQSLTWLAGQYDTDASASDPMDVGWLEYHAVGSATWLDETWMLWRETDPTLRWRRQCRELYPGVSGFSAGALVVHDDAGNLLRLEHGGCRRVVVTYNGDTL
ncbi:MAG: hypothetical protein IT373_04380 [Polyangiaceae bacterium]|nr:hypothetical protein [Polyangiaceae bacterium]